MPNHSGRLYPEAAAGILAGLAPRDRAAARRFRYAGVCRMVSPSRRVGLPRSDEPLVPIRLKANSFASHSGHLMTHRVAALCYSSIDEAVPLIADEPF